MSNSAYVDSSEAESVLYVGRITHCLLHVIIIVIVNHCPCSYIRRIVYMI